MVERRVEAPCVLVRIQSRAPWCGFGIVRVKFGECSADIRSDGKTKAGSNPAPAHFKFGGYNVKNNVQRF